VSQVGTLYPSVLHKLCPRSVLYTHLYPDVCHLSNELELASQGAILASLLFLNRVLGWLGAGVDDTENHQALVQLKRTTEVAFGVGFVQIAGNRIVNQPTNELCNDCILPEVRWYTRYAGCCFCLFSLCLHVSRHASFFCLFGLARACFKVGCVARTCRACRIHWQ
jgi:hypothetical protein